jgi:hypothetical protein
MDNCLQKFLREYGEIIGKDTRQFEAQRGLVNTNKQICGNEVPKIIYFIPTEYATFASSTDFNTLFKYKYSSRAELWKKRRAIVLYGTMFNKENLNAKKSIGPASKVLNAKCLNRIVYNFILSICDDLNALSYLNVYVDQDLCQALEYKLKYMAKLTCINYKTTNNL